MRSIIEFALFAWVGISIVAVLVQLVRIARYKRTNKAAPAVEAEATKAEPPTIDLGERLAPTEPPSASTAEAPSAATVGAASIAPQPTSSAPAAEPVPGVKLTTPPAPSSPPVTTPPVAEPASPPVAEPQPAPVAAEPATPAESPTLADLLAGVRLPWNLLPTVDQGREPSNDRVVLITSDGEPSQIGVDVADELERLGFTVTPSGDDTAVASREGRSLGLRIIEEPMTAEIDGVQRFPSATESSVALDIWVDVNASA